MKERTINGLLTVLDNCDNRDLRSPIICRNCILNNNIHHLPDFNICEMFTELEMTNEELLKKGI